MEVVGFVASVGQLAGACLKLSTALYEYAERVSNAPKLVGDLAKDVKLTSSVLEHLSELFNEATSQPLIRPGALRTAKETIAECKSAFSEMETLIATASRSMGRLVLPFKESKLQLLIARLASLKSTLQLLLQMLQYSCLIATQYCIPHRLFIPITHL